MTSDIGVATGASEDTLRRSAKLAEASSGIRLQAPVDVIPQWLNGVAPNVLQVLQALQAAVYATDAQGRITFFNEAAATLWGCRPELGKSEWCGSWRLYWPDGRPMPHDECPMAVALKTGQASSGHEAIAERPDGSRIPFRAYPTPLYDESGVLTGAVNMLVDTSDRLDIERSQQFLAAIVESSDDPIVSKNLNGIIQSWNHAAERLFGYSPEEAIGSPIIMLIPPDLHAEETEILGRIRKGERVEHYETVRRRKDGTLVDVALTVSPIRNRRGEVVGASKIARDISERRRADEQQQLLLREMNHRVKNLFSLANGVIGLSARYAKTPAELAEAVRERISALARAHELTLPSIAPTPDQGSQETTLDALLRTIASPYAALGQKGEDRLALEGPEVAIGKNAITSFALLLHEAATNAAKYGALSTARGRVFVDWRIEGNEVRLTWRERGGPPVLGMPENVGFGTTLADATVGRQFGGKIVRDWQSEGLVLHLSVPVESLTR
jgi:PAS domain S-box-containing protein